MSERVERGAAAISLPLIVKASALIFLSLACLVVYAAQHAPSAAPDAVPALSGPAITAPPSAPTYGGKTY